MKSRAVCLSVLLICCLVPVTQAQAKRRWKKTYESTLAVGYVDKNSVKRKGDQVTATFKHIYTDGVRRKSVDGTGTPLYFKESRSIQTLNCATDMIAVDETWDISLDRSRRSTTATFPARKMGGPWDEAAKEMLCTKKK